MFFFYPWLCQKEKYKLKKNCRGTLAFCRGKIKLPRHFFPNSEGCNYAIFRTLAYLKPKASWKGCWTCKMILKSPAMLTRHIQNPAIRYYSAIIRHNQNLVQQLLTQKPGLLGILGYLKPFHKCILMHIQNPVIFTKIYKYRTLTYLKPDTYSEHSKIFRWSFFTKIFENCNYFLKCSILDLLSGF